MTYMFLLTSGGSPQYRCSGWEIEVGLLVVVGMWPRSLRRSLCLVGARSGRMANHESFGRSRVVEEVTVVVHNCKIGRESGSPNDVRALAVTQPPVISSQKIVHFWVFSPFPKILYF